jgi:hypothetical protein
MGEHFEQLRTKSSSTSFSWCWQEKQQQQSIIRAKFPNPPPPFPSSFNPPEYDDELFPLSRIQFAFIFYNKTGQSSMPSAPQLETT